jgi:hypothetical protein
MGTLFLVVIHIILVSAVYITAYRTGYGVCRDDARLKASTATQPLIRRLEELNLDIETFLDDDKDR